MIKIKKFYTRGLTDAMMFGYINAFRMNFPNITLEKVIINFMKHHNIDSEEFNLDTCRTTYYRMEKEYIEVKQQ